MIDELRSEYVSCAKTAASVDYGDARSVRQFNKVSERMREIVDQVVRLGDDAILRFTSVLDIEPASVWAAHHLVEMADLDPSTLAKCFTRVERAKEEAESEARMADAFGEETWLNEWRRRANEWT